MLANLSSTHRSLLVLVLIGVSFSEAHGEAIKDHAYLFSDYPWAVEQAENEIARMRRHPPHKSILLETIDDPENAPLAWIEDGFAQEMVEEYNLEDAGQRKELFEKIAEERMRVNELDGIYILISLKPQHIFVGPTPSAANVFTEDDANRTQAILVNALKLNEATTRQDRLRRWITKLKSKRPGHGLTEAVNFAHRRLNYNMPNEGSSWTWTLGTVALVGVTWILLRLIRGRMQKAQGHDASIRYDRQDLETPMAPLGGAIGAAAGESLAAWLFGHRKREAAHRESLASSERFDSIFPAGEGPTTQGSYEEVP